MDRLERLQPGSRWQYFKGGIYEIIAIATDANHPGNSWAIYRNIATPRVWARPVEDFLAVLGNGTNFYRFEEVQID